MYSLIGHSPTVTISGDCINSTQCDGINWTFTTDNDKANMDALIAKVQEYVERSVTATNSVCR